MLKDKSILLFMAMLLTTTATLAQKAKTAEGSACDSKLIAYHNWKETPRTEWNLLLSTKNSGNLTYLGAHHSKDVSHPQFAQILNAWEKQSPTIAFFEGSDRGIGSTDTETIQKFGESGYVRYLAKVQGIKTQSLEPGPQDEVKYLLSLNKFTPEQIKLFFILREASRLRERNGMGEEQIKTIIAQVMEKANQMVPAFANVLPNVASLQPAYNKHWSVPANWWEAPAAWFTPGGDGEKTGGKFTNDINRHSSEFRDLYMYRLLTNAVLRGEKVFAVVGRNHVPMQAPAIKCALK